MNRGLGMMTAFLVLAAAFCVGGTVMSKERNDYAQENERYALLEDDFAERTKEILEQRGYRNSGVTITWTRETGGVRSYRVEIHHRGIGSLGEDEKESLTKALYCEAFCGEVEALSIIYT